ncbi:hypothetical protein SAMN06265173_11543 [Thalassovita litoralis]|uniref:Uncharacterized protein n=1 Tax=Thalassovita litoralis TaxID=1010611 RepID=A0A521EAC5_9RHOB|nr:hypothetical protein SAMN06265173_11543 [Thalassovita litoralis]
MGFTVIWIMSPRKIHRGLYDIGVLGRIGLAS